MAKPKLIQEMESKLDKSGGTLTGSIRYKGGGYDGSLITIKDGNKDGTGVGLCAGGLTVVSGGEGAHKVLESINPTTEDAWVTGDGNVIIATGLQNTIDGGSKWMYKSSGYCAYQYKDHNAVDTAVDYINLEQFGIEWQPTTWEENLDLLMSKMRNGTTLISYCTTGASSHFAETMRVRLNQDCGTNYANTIDYNIKVEKFSNSNMPCKISVYPNQRYEEYVCYYDKSGTTVYVSKFRKTPTIEKVTSLSLLNGWTYAFSANYTPTVSYNGYSVTISGGMTSGTLTKGTTLFTLPSEFRPTSNRIIYIPKTDGTWHQLVVLTNGNVNIDSTTWTAGDYITQINYVI